MDKTEVINLTDHQIKHLEIIEGVIERLSQNSFALKGWAMTLVVAICALSAAGSERRFIVVAIIPIIVFWFLDAFYLRRERKYRELYNRVRLKAELQFDMDISVIEGRKTGFFNCLFSASEWPFYLAILVGVIVIVFWLGVL